MGNSEDTKELLSPKERQLQHLRMWAPGQSGNPAGRPKGSRSKLSEDFLADWYADYLAHGLEVIEAVRKKHPEKYFEGIIKLLPRDVKLEVPQLQKIIHEVIDVTPHENLNDSNKLDSGGSKVESQAIESKGVPALPENEDPAPTHEVDGGE